MCLLGSSDRIECQTNPCLNSSCVRKLKRGNSFEVSGVPVDNIEEYHTLISTAEWRTESGPLFVHCDFMGEYIQRFSDGLCSSAITWLIWIESILQQEGFHYFLCFACETPFYDTIVHLSWQVAYSCASLHETFDTAFPPSLNLHCKTFVHTVDFCCIFCTCSVHRMRPRLGGGEENFKCHFSFSKFWLSFFVPRPNKRGVWWGRRIR